MKTCKTCLVKKPLEDFHVAKLGLMGRDAHCASCKAEKRKPGIHGERKLKAEQLALRKIKGVKLCNVCKEEKPYSLFNTNAQTSDGIDRLCSDCNKEKLRKWREDNPDGFRKWYDQNREEHLIRSKAYRDANKAVRTENYAKWAKENKHIVNSLIAKRNARKLNATPKWADLNKIREIYKECAKKTLETGIRYEVDHYYPLQGETVCGLHCESNLRIITKTENVSKKNKMPEAA